MRGLLNVLCTLGTIAAAVAGGCTVFFQGAAVATAPPPGDAASRVAALNAMAVGVAAIVVSAAIVAVNAALATALARGQAPRRNRWFVLLAIVDFAIAAAVLVARLTWQGPFPVGDVAAFLLPAALVLKGVLTLMLPAAPPRLPPHDLHPQ